MVAGFENPTDGTITLDGADITTKAPNQRNMGMIFQSYALFPNMTVGQNIGFGLRVRKSSKTDIQDRVKEMVSLVNLEKHIDKYPYQLSGGQQQRVSLARALAIRPDVLLLDEPLSALDAKIRVNLRDQIREIQKRLGITAIFVTHDQEEALSISDRVVVMQQGKVDQVGTPSEIYNFPRTDFVANFVGTLNTANAEVVDPDKGIISVDGVQFETSKDLKNRHKGDKVQFSIRPERLSFASEEKKDNVFDATIENITFLGSIVRIQILVGDAHFYLDIFNNPFLELLKIGEKVQVTCSREAVMIIGSA